jgi:hypothetical protein
VGLAVKHRQLARQVGALIEDPLASSMASFNLTVAPEEGAAYIFGSWVCIANGSGSFDSHLANPKGPEASTPTSNHDIDELSNNLGEIQISNLIENRESESGTNSAPTRDGSELDSPFGLHNTATVYREALQSESLSTLEKD